MLYRLCPAVRPWLHAIARLVIALVIMVDVHASWAQDATPPSGAVDQQVASTAPRRLPLEEALRALLPSDGIEVSFSSETLRGTVVTLFPDMTKWDQIRAVLGGFDFAIVTRRAGNIDSIQRIVILQRALDGERAKQRLETWRGALDGPGPDRAKATAASNKGPLDGEIPAATLFERSATQDGWLTQDSTATFSALERLAGREDIPNMSAGLPTYFVEPTLDQTDRFADYMGGYTQQMGVRDLQSLGRLLSVETPPASPPVHTKPKTSP